MYAKEMSEDEAHAWLEDILTNPVVGKKRPRSKAKVATASA
jgi:hypothetical protein